MNALVGKVTYHVFTVKSPRLLHASATVTCGDCNMEAELCLPGAVQKVSKRLEMHIYSKRLEIMLQ